MGINVNVSPTIQQNTPLRGVRSGSTAEPDYNVKYVPQTLTEQQQAQARQNIGVEVGEQVQANWNETDTESPAYIQNKPTIPAAPVQSDWNESDTASLAYIQNKPTIPAAPVQSNWNETNTASLAYIQNKPNIAADEIPLRFHEHVFLKSTYNEAQVQRPQRENVKTYKDGVLVTSGNNVYIGNRYRGAYTGVDIVSSADITSDHIPITLSSLTNDSVTVMERWDQQNRTDPNLTVPSNFAGKIILKLNNHSSSNSVFSIRCKGSDNVDLITFFDNYAGLVGNTIINGKIVFPNLPVPTTTDTFTTVPTLTNCTGIYIHRSKVNDWKTWITGLYVANTDLSSIFNKIVPYDFVAWYSDFDPEIVSLPTVPLTMTDENSTVISGNFVAQDVTITPAS